MSKSGDKVITFDEVEFREFSYSYECRIVNGGYTVNRSCPSFLEKRIMYFVCPNEIKRHHIIGIYQTEEDLGQSGSVLFLDCNLRVFKSRKNYFDELETIILGEHFSAMPEMIKNMVHDLQEKNPSLRFKFPIIKYEDGRELDVSNYLLPPLLDYGDEIIRFTKQKEQTPTYRFRIVNGECKIDDCSDYDQKMKMKQFTCPNVIEGYPVVGIYQQKGYGSFCNGCKILLLDCNLQVFETNKKEFNELKTIILGEHFSATQEMINKMIYQLQENNPSLLKKFPEIRYWDGREFEIPSFLVPLPLVVAVQPKNSKRKLIYRTQDRNIKVRSTVMVEKYSTSKKSKEQDEYVEGVVCKIIKKFDGDIEELKEIKSVISYSSDIIINDITNLFDYKITRIDENTYEVSDSNKTARIKVMTVFDKYEFSYVGLLYNLKKEKDGSFKSGAISNYKYNALCEGIIEPPYKNYATFEEMQADLDRCTERDKKGWISIHTPTEAFKCIEINKVKLIKDSYNENAYFEGEPKFYLANGKIYAYYCFIE